MKKIRIVLFSLPFLFGFNLTFSEGCDDYPGQVGQATWELDGDNYKIMFTYGAEVLFDDYDLMLTSLDIAEKEAKIKLAELMDEEVGKGCRNEDVKSSSVKYFSKDKEVEKETVKDRVCVLASQSSALLTGVVNLGSCYDPGKKVLVTIGISNEMIERAGIVRGAINDSLLETGGTSLSHSECTSEDSDDCEVEEESKAKMPLNKVEAFSNTEKLKKF